MTEFLQKDADLGGTVPPVITPPVTPPVPAPDPRYADLPPAAEGLPPPPAMDAGFGEVFGAAWTSETIRTDAWGYEADKRRALADEMFGQLPREAKARVWDKFADNSTGWIAFEDLVMNEASAIAAQTPETGKIWGRYPLTKVDFDRRINDARRADLAAAEQVLAQDGGAVAEFLGGSARAMTDQASLAMLPFGAGGGSALRIIGTEALLGAAGEAAVLPREYQVAADLGLEDPDAVARILTGAALGGGLSAGVLAVAKGIGLIRARRSGLQAARPAGADPLEFEARVDDAEDAMTGRETVQQRYAGQMGAGDPGTLPAILSQGGYSEVIDAGQGWTVVRAPDGTAIRREGTRAWRNNNPGNIEYGPFARSMGAIGTDGRFAVFPTYEAGRAAKGALLFTSKGYRGKTIGEAIARYAPPSENDTRAYTRAIMAATGARADTPLSALTPAQREAMLDAMERVEGFRPGTENGVQAGAPRRGISTPLPGEDMPAFTPTTRGYTGTGQVTAGDGFRVDVAYEIVDAASLIRSSGDMQPRDRSRIASDEWIATTAARLDPAQLMPSPTADRGAPIVGPDNMVESGNGRFGAITRAYERHPDRAAAYRAQIEAAGFQIPEGMARPILIARRKTDLSREDRVRFALDAQDSGVAVMTPTEVARASSRAMTPPVLARLDPAQPITAEANAGFVRSALAGLPRSARNAMFDAGGLLNKAGERQLREAVFARAWPDPDILARFAEGDAGELKSLLDALDRAAPAWAALKADIEAGTVRPEMDIGAHVLDAMRLIGAARDLAARDGLPIGKAIAQLLDDMDLWEGAISPLTAALVRKFWQNGRAAPADRVADFLTRYASEARKSGGTDALFDGPGPGDILRALDRETFGALPDDFGQARGYAAPPAREPDPLPDPGFNKGAMAPEAQAAAEALAIGHTADAPAAGGMAAADAEAQAAAEASAARAEFDGLEITLPDGASYSARDLLDDLDADDLIETVAETCALNPGAFTNA